MVKNFLVVVMIEHGSGPNDVTVININTWNETIKVWLGQVKKSGVFQVSRPIQTKVRPNLLAGSQMKQNCIA